MDIRPFIDALESGIPDLEVASVELADEGMDSIALLVNREWMFRFPKHDGVSARVELEARLLPELQRVVDVRITGSGVRRHRFMDRTQVLGLQESGGSAPTRGSATDR